MRAHYKNTRKEDNIGKLGDNFFRKAKRIGRPISEHPKEKISVRVDADVLSAFKATGRGWQTLMNSVLRAWADSR